MTAQQPILFARVLFPFCLGIVFFEGTLLTKLNLLLSTTAIFSLFLLFIINILYDSPKVYHYKHLWGYLLQFFFFIAGAAWTAQHDIRQDPEYFARSRGQMLKIWIADEPQQQAGFTRFTAAVTAVYRNGKKYRATGKILVALSGKNTNIPMPGYGASFLIPASYRLVDPSRNPAAFDYRSWLSKQHIHHQIFLRPEQMITLHKMEGSALISYALSLRRRQVAVYRKLIRNETSFAVASTLILGYRADMDSATLDAYSRTGTIHALSVSGMHVGLIYTLLEWAFAAMNRSAMLRWLKVTLILLLIWWYTLITGCSASVLRSAIMLTSYILGQALERNSSAYHTLALSAFALLLWNPFLLWDVGFQLSYLSVFGLVYLYPKVNRLLHFKWRLFQWLWNMVAVSLAAQFITFPWTIYYFHQFPVYFLISNLFISLPVTILMYAGLLILLLHCYWLAPPFEWLITSMDEGLSYIAHLPYSTIAKIWLRKEELWLLIAAMCAVLAAFSWKKKPLIWLSLLLLLSLNAMLIRDELMARQQKLVIQFTLKRKYAVAFITGTRALLITDLSPAEKAFKFHIQPALDSCRVSSITCREWPQELKGPDVSLSHHQLHFGHLRILMADTSLQHKHIQNHPRFDILWAHGLSNSKVKALIADVYVERKWRDGTPTVTHFHKYPR